MMIIKGTKIGILSIVLVLFLVDEKAVVVDCEPDFNEENLLQNPDLLGLIFTEDNEINTFHLNDGNGIKLVTSSKPRNPIFSCKRKTLYWIDESSKILAREYLYSQSIKLIFEDKSMGIEALALDHTADKLFIGNTVFHTIEVVDLKTGYHGIVRSQTVPRIISLTIDPNEGYMFILGVTELIRMDLDGLNFQYISQGPARMFDYNLDGLNFQYILQGLPFPLQNRYEFRNYSINNFIALDLLEKRVYWMKVETMDTVNATIWSTTYEGTDVKFHLRLEVGPQFTTENNVDVPIYSPMVFFSNIPYWVNNNQGVIKRINLSNANDSEVVTNPCDQGNGGCQHLCILSRSSKSKYRCFCNIGYELAKDGKSCSLPTKFIMFIQNKFVRGISWREDTKQYIDVLDPSKHTPGFSYFLNLDIKEGVMYRHYATSNHDQILSVDLNNTKNMILQPDFLAKYVTSTTFDWASKNLYYFSNYYSDEKMLCVLNVRKPTYSKILSRSQYFREGLAVHPNRGYVFFTESQIIRLNNLFRMHTDGSDSIILHEKRHSIKSITIDYAEDKVYWTEDQFFSYVDQTIHCSDLDGKNVMKVNVQFLYRPSIVMMVIYGDWVYFINNYAHNLERVPKKGGKSELLITSSVTVLQSFDPSVQPTKSDHPCVGSENSCDKLCFAVPNKENIDSLERVCACPYGEKLADDGISCIATVLPAQE